MPCRSHSTCGNSEGSASSPLETASIHSIPPQSLFPSGVAPLELSPTRSLMPEIVMRECRYPDLRHEKFPQPGIEPATF